MYTHKISHINMHTQSMDGNVEKNLNRQRPEISITISNQHHCLYIVIRVLLFPWQCNNFYIYIVPIMCVSYPSEIEHELYKVNFINIDI